MKKEYDFSDAALVRGPIKSKKQVMEALHSKSKVLTSIRLDKEVIETAKKIASNEGIGYLTWINKKLREVLLNEKGLEKRIERIESILFKEKL